MFSCQNEDETEFLKREFAKKRVRVNESLVSGKSVTKPLNSWVTIAVLSDRYCLAYKTPFSSSFGELSYFRFDKSCQFTKEALVKIKNINDLIVNVVNKNVDSLQLKLSWLKGSSKNREVLTFSLLNSKSKRAFSKLDHNLEMSFLADVFYGDYPESDKEIADGNICHGINGDCKNVVSYRCDECKSGFYEVVDFNCPQGGSKYCGSDQCGEKNQPACPRGYNILETKLRTLCFDGSPAGFCSPGLKTFCNEDQILICI